MKKYLAVLVVCLFLSTSVTVMSQTDFSEQDSESLDVLFDRMDIESYHDYYKEYLSEDINESVCSDDIGFELGVIYNNNGFDIFIDDTGLMDSCWPMKSQNTRHTGYSQYSTEGINGVIQWSYKSSDWIDGGIVIDIEGVIYFGDQDGFVYALYPSGTLKWKYDLHGRIWSSPAIATDGTVYIGTYENSMYAINPDGTLKWEYFTGGPDDPIGGSISSSPVIGNDGTIYFGTLGPGNIGKVHSVYPNGTKKWEYNTGYWIVSDPAIGDDGTIYIGSGDSYLYALNPNGTLKWRFKTGDIVKSHPSIAEDGTIFFDSFDGYLYALNPIGTLKWKYNRQGSGCDSASIDEDGIIYIGGSKFDAVYPNGTLKWRFNFGSKKNSDHSSPAISADGIIYIGVTENNDFAGFLYAIDKESGILKWKREIANNWVYSSPCIGENGAVYIGSSSSGISGDTHGTLYAFGGNWTNQPPYPPEITGPTNGKPSQSLDFNFFLNDPDLHSMELFVEWDDGGCEEWIGPFDSGTTVTLSHTWSEEGAYIIEAKARDTYDGRESEKGNLHVYLPKNKQYRNVFFQWLFSHSDDFLLRVLNL